MTANNLGPQNWLRIQGGHAQMKIMFIEFFTPGTRGKDHREARGRRRATAVVFSVPSVLRTSGRAHVISNNST